MSFGIYITEPESGPICDFCSSPSVYANYPCTNFVHDVVDGLEINSAAHWAACRACSDLIEVNNWDGLLDRSVKTFQKKYGFLPGLRESIRLMHQQFRQHRKMAC